MTEPRSSEGGPLPWLAFGVCCAIWSSTFLFIRIGNETLAPVWASALRLALATGLLVVLALVTRQPWPRGAALRAAAWFGFVDFGVSLPLLYWGERDVPSGIAGVLYATIPLTTALFARMFGLEPLRRRTLGAASLALVGVAVLVSSQLAGSLSGLALAAVGAGAVTASLAGVLLKRGSGGSAITTNAVAHGVGVPPVWLASRLLGEPQHLPATRAAWVPVLYLTIVGSVIAFLAFTWLVPRWPATRISFIAVITPVLALALGIVVQHESIGPASVLGAAIVIGAVVVALAGEGPAARS